MQSPTDKWASGAAYDLYMGRWSRGLAPLFLQWLGQKPDSNWLEIGCGTGALTAAIGELCEPASLTACDRSEPFVLHARSHVVDARARFVTAEADALPRSDDGFDVIVSGLVLNFLPDPNQAVASMRERLRPGGVVAAYVWDYATGLEFLRHFWDEVVASDPAAAALDEGLRFPICSEGSLASVFRAAGLAQVDTAGLELVTEFADFEDYWQPFLGGTGPAPSYVASLEAASRETLRERLRQRLDAADDGRIRLRARAWAVRGSAS